MSTQEIGGLLGPYLDLGGPRQAEVPEAVFEQLRVYLELLVKWNARTNLTAIREPKEMVRRHFGESLFAARHLPEAETLLDFGSGAGFPGLPIQLYRPGLRVTLAESQNKKATFLREVVRTLGLKTEIWGARVEAMAAGRQFDVVTLRAVDHMEQALAAAEVRTARWLAILTTGRQAPVEVKGFELLPAVGLPGSTDGCLLLARRVGL
ncbi:MAG TPA: 16S rRNA (guanine(527)-N(7))-methyltransferase RsmG [Granulicella sp.]|nr:16S rRNA (guanine(527)-N(7))-methyltransferase RsmG [Granulicella sp.]